MIMKKIGVLGARGTIGSSIVQYLQKNHEVIKGVRTFSDASNNEIVVDALDDASLSNFCKNCDVVINAIGPSYINSKKIIDCVNSCGKPCIDLFGGAELEEKLNNKEMVNIINAGCVPGLSGIVMAYLAKECGVPDKITLIHGGNESGGLAALKDIVYSSVDEYSLPNRIIHNGGIEKKIKFTDMKEKIEYFPEPVYKDPLLDREGIRIHEKYNVDNIEQYHCIRDIRSKELIAEGCIACAGIQHTEEKEEVFKKLLKKQLLIVGDSMQWFSMVGISDNAEKAHKLVIRAKGSSFISGIVAAVACEKLINDENPANRTMWAFEYVDAEKLLSVLKECGVFVEHIVEEKAWELMYGEI